MNILIKNVRIVDVNKDLYGDVYIENGVIKEVSQGIDKDCSVIEERRVCFDAFICRYALPL